MQRQMVATARIEIVNEVEALGSLLVTLHTLRSHLPRDRADRIGLEEHVLRIQGRLDPYLQLMLALERAQVDSRPGIRQSARTEEILQCEFGFDESREHAWIAELLLAEKCVGSVRTRRSHVCGHRAN